MKRLIGALILALAFAGISAHAETAGRVLLAAGDVVAIRAGKALPLAAGTLIEDKDTLRTGAASNLQVRFTDNSIMSLRENSELSIEEYRFGAGAGGLEKAFYKLLKGGLRTVTGLIGHTRHEEYRIDSVTATIGIRGTHFALMSCQAGSCLNPDGSKAKDGLYGGVTDGVVAATTKTGEYRFGAGETFFAASIESPVEKLIGPPVFLSDRLEGQKRGGKKAESGGGSENGSGSEDTKKGGIAADSRPNTLPAALPQLQVVTTETLNPQGTATALPPANGWVVIYPLPKSAEVVFDDKDVGVFNSSNHLLSYGTAGSYPYGTVNGGTIVDSGSYTYPFGAILTWGRWTGNTQVVTSSGTTLANVPVLFGTATGLTQDGSLKPTGGIATYTYVGGPKPVDAGGNIGTIKSNTLSLDFTAQQATFAMGVDFSGIGANFTVSGIGTKTNGNHAGDFSGSLSGSCAGSGCASTSVTGAFGGGMDGPNGYELAVVGGGFYGTVAGPVVFLNAYQSSSFTPGSTATSNQTGWLAYGAPNAVAVLPLVSPVFSGTNLIAYGDGTNFPSGALNSGTVAETGSATLVDGSIMRWGRWTGAGVQVIDVGNVTLNPTTGVPYALGNASTVLPTSGSFTYTFAGGPNPVDTTGTVGRWINGGAFNITFGPTSTISVATPLSLAVGAANFNLTTCTSGCTFTTSSPVTVLTGTCSGGACGATAPSTAAGVGAGVFVGAQAAGLAVAGTIISPAPTVSFAAGYKR